MFNFEFWRKKKTIVYPCKECLVNTMCKQKCDKLITNSAELREFFLKYECCPDCGGNSFMEGPCGGASINIKCNGCNHWFNMGLPLFVERIRINDDGSFRE